MWTRTFAKACKPRMKPGTSWNRSGPSSPGGRIFLPMAVLAAAGLALRATVRWIENQPDRYPEEKQRLEPQGTTHVIERSDGTRLRAIVAGQGPAVVLAHGMYSSVLQWNIVWDRLLSAGFRVVCFDQRGHAQSSVGADGVSTRAMAGDYPVSMEGCTPAARLLRGAAGQPQPGSGRSVRPASLATTDTTAAGVIGLARCS